jgi:hypothetical protein
MRLRASGLAAASLLAVASCFAAREAVASSVCGCDPAASTLGVERPGADSFRLAVENRYLWKESGLGSAAETEREDRLLMRLQYAAAEPLVLQIEAPFYLSKNLVHFHGATSVDDTARGPGDATVGARYELLRAGARQTLAVTGILKLPTGANNRSSGGEPPHEHQQLGSGAFDQLLGLNYVYDAEPWTLYGSMTGRLNGTNSRGFRYGHSVVGTAGARRTLLDGGRLLLSLEAQLRAAGADRFADGSHDPNTGGRLLYATAGTGFAFTRQFAMYVLLQVPVAKHLHGVQTEHPVAYGMLSYDLPL